jgi:hypothetical protein
MSRLAHEVLPLGHMRFLGKSHAQIGWRRGRPLSLDWLCQQALTDSAST